MDFLNEQNDIQQEVEQDRLGGYQPFESGAYLMTVKAAYLDKSVKGSHNVVILFETEDGKSFKHVEYITNREGKNFYVKDGKKNYLPGFSKMNGLSQLLCGKKLGESTIEEKVHKIWDKTQSAEVPQSRPTLMDWIGKKAYVGIIKVLENKSVKQGDEYVPTAETRETNEIDKFFNEEKKTLAEIAASSDAKFYADWEKARKDYVKDKTDKSLQAGSPSAATPATGTPLKFDD